jgi:hypothetical protein
VEGGGNNLGSTVFVIRQGANGDENATGNQTEKNDFDNMERRDRPQ